MKPEQQIIAIATACGWTHTKTIHNPDVCAYGRHPEYTGNVSWDLPLPDYLNDLNAMHEAEKVLTADQTWDQVKLLVNYRQAANGFPLLSKSETLKLHSSTAAQRAEAFLKTLNLWEGAK